MQINFKLIYYNTANLYTYTRSVNIKLYNTSISTMSAMNHDHVGNIIVYAMYPITF